jgi:hypothetical protein
MPLYYVFVSKLDRTVTLPSLTNFDMSISAEDCAVSLARLVDSCIHLRAPIECAKGYHYGMADGIL